MFFGLTLVVASVADAKYDRALDGKTKVWRDPGQQRMHVSWSGERDEKGYATGKGTLTYYRTERNWETGTLLPETKFIPVRKLKGKMVDGKLEGSVTTVSKGKTYRAKFEDGHKTGEWVASSDASSKKKASEEPAKPTVVVETAPKPATEPTPPAEAPPPAPKLEEHVAQFPAPASSPAAPKKDVAVETGPAEGASPSADSLRSLAMPPSSLRVASLNQASPKPEEPPVEVSESVSPAIAEEASSVAAPATTSVNDDDARAISALDSEYHSAVKTNDAATIDRILADDFVMMRGPGQTSSKSDILKQARDKQAKYERHEIESGSQKIRVWRDTAVVTETLWVKGTEGGKPVDHKVSVTETFVRTPDGWRYVSGQASPSK